MLRSIAGVIVGYIALAVALFVAFSLMYMILGTDGAYKPGSWEVSTTWSIGALIIGFFVALLGGFVCKLVSGRRRGAVVAMAVLIAVLGTLEFVMQMNREPPAEPRPEQVATMDAAAKSSTPLWVAGTNVLIGTVGVLIGGNVVRSRPTPDPKADSEQ
tara:strand:+ start:108 stop:581 length:474 start_codon:yes stop_codon:yes gene_type:complete